MPSKQWDVVWTAYMKYRAKLRGFELSRIEEIVRYSSERYFDTATGRHVAIGRHDKTLVVVPYEVEGNAVIPITVHPTTRQQVNFRLKTGRYVHEE